MTGWEIWLCNQRGYRERLLHDVSSFSLAQVVNNVGAWTMTLPGYYSSQLFGKDKMLEFWRQPLDGVLKNVMVGFVRRTVVQTDSQGLTTLTVAGPDCNDLLRRRIVSSTDTTKYSSTDNADDVMKMIVRSNLGASSTDTARDLSAYNVTVAADIGEGQSITVNVPYLNVLRVCQDAALASANLGTPVYFGFYPVWQGDGTIGFDFRTKANFPGLDRTFGAANGVLFSPEIGNLDLPYYEENAAAEATYIYIGGQGDPPLRRVLTVSDTVRVAESVWARCELFTDARDKETDAELNTVGYQALEAARPKKIMRGNLLDVPAARYGIEWEYGDKITVSYIGQQFDAVIRSVQFGMSQDGAETIGARVELFA